MIGLQRPCRGHRARFGRSGRGAFRRRLLRRIAGSSGEGVVGPEARRILWIEPHLIERLDVTPHLGPLVARAARIARSVRMRAHAVAALFGLSLLAVGSAWAQDSTELPASPPAAPHPDPCGSRSARHRDPAALRAAARATRDPDGNALLPARPLRQGGRRGMAQPDERIAGGRSQNPDRRERLAGAYNRGFRGLRSHLPGLHALSRIGDPSARWRKATAWRGSFQAALAAADPRFRSNNRGCVNASARKP